MSASTRDVRYIPLCQLREGSANPRKLGDPDYAGMAASLKAVGQLQNIIVFPLPGDAYEVRAGDRRFGGFCLLRDAGDVPSDHPVRCLVSTAADDAAMSATENMQRQAMHPADEWDACKRMRDAGMSVDAIADVLGCTPLVVERRLTVSAAASLLIELYKTSDISTDQLIALCAADDHMLQVSVWQNARDKDPKELRRLVLAADVDAAIDPRVAFIGGIDTYLRAGGTVRRDLFSNVVNGGFITDTALLNRLVCEHLERASAPLQSSEGWAWVVAEASCNREALLRFGRIVPVRRHPTSVEQRDVACLRAEDATLQAEYLELKQHADPSRAEVRAADIVDRRAAISEALASIDQACLSYLADEKAYAGALVWLDSQGQMRIERGLVRPEDRAALARAKRSISGGRETKAVGRKAHAMSKAVQDSLIDYRNTAAQVALSANPRVAKILFACKVVAEECGIAGEAAMLPLKAMEQNVDADHAPANRGADQQHLVDRLKAAGANAMGRQPSGMSDLWREIAARSDAELDAIMAYGVAKMLQLGDGRSDMAKSLLEAMAFDVGKHYTPTAANFFSKVPKEFSIGALLECGSVPNAESVSRMTKRELAELAEKKVKGTGWVPAVMRASAGKSVN